MLEYTAAYLSPFSWARAAYANLLAGSTTTKINVDFNSLQKPVLNQLNSYPILIKNAKDWNNFSFNYVHDLAGLYASMNKADEYINTLRQKLNSRLSDAETKLSQLETGMRGFRQLYPLQATTNISIAGGDTSWIDNSSKFYQEAKKLDYVLSEGCYQLPSVGTFSAIRASNTLGGTVTLEKSLVPLTFTGSLLNIVDGSSETFWTSVAYQPAVVKRFDNTVPWLQTEYTHGSAILLSYYLDRPTLAGEIFIDPVSTEPFTLLSVSWTPTKIKNAESDPNFSTLNGWTYGTTSGQQALGLGNVPCGFTYSTSGAIQQTFSILNSLNTSLSGVSSSYSSVNQRFEFLCDARSDGDCTTNIKILWKDASGNVLNSDETSTVLSSFYRTQRLIGYAPTLAASGTIFLTINTLNTPATSYFTNSKLYAGEERWASNTIIDKTKTIPLPTVVESSRFSFCLAQTSLRVENNTNRSNKSTYEDISYVDNFINEAVKKELNTHLDTNSNFIYRLGLKELDLRYTEYIPKATLTSIPLNTTKEIRNLWVDVDTDTLSLNAVGFYIIPFSRDTNYKIPIRPFQLGVLDSSGTSLRSSGDILAVFTPEEDEAGWAADQSLKIIAEPFSVSQTYNGTDRNGLISLDKTPHLRRIKVGNTQLWLNSYSIWPTNFDPNSSSYFGVGNSALATRIREGQTSVISSADIVSTQGYVPLNVTVSTDRWIAYQDTVGLPTATTIRRAVKEVLATANIESQTVISSSEFITFDQYTLQFNFGDFLTRNTSQNGLFAKLQSQKFSNSLKAKSIKEAISDTSIAANAADIIKAAQTEYNTYKANGVLPKTTDKNFTTTTTTPALSSYQTKFKPILQNSSGSMFTLYWYKTETEEKLPIASSNYTLDAQTGIVTVQMSKPTDYDAIIADYNYVNHSEESTYSEQLYGAISDPQSTADFPVSIRKYPICRNITDYTTGEVPTIKAPNFDALSESYYPVIEYYLTDRGELKFSDDFFAYGNTPAKITVEYETLDIQPRLSIFAARSGGVNITPRLYGITLKTKEIGAVVSK